MAETLTFSVSLLRNAIYIIWESKFSYLVGFLLFGYILRLFLCICSAPSGRLFDKKIAKEV